MKKTTLSILLSLVLVGSTIPVAVFAQEVYDYNYGGNTYDYNYGGGDTYDYNYGGNTYDYNYGGVDTYDYNYGGNTYDYNYGAGDTYDYNYGGNTYDYNYGGGDTYDYNYGAGDTYDYNYGSTGVTYDYDYTYTTPSWTGYDYGSYNYGPGYTYPSQPVYTPAPVYTQPVYTQPVYTQPVYTPPVYTPVTPTQPICTMEAKVCPDGTTVGRTGPNCSFAACPVTVPVTPVTRCSDGSLPSPITGCTRTTTIPVINTTICADGLAPVNGSCIRTNTIPVISNIICSDGSYPVNGSCVRIATIPTINYQTCWDGSVIPLTSVCPAQYKVCPNGTSVPVNQACYYSPVPAPYVPPVVVKFNNVITSVATEISAYSARCNGIGLIASNAPSTGWFEYGETANLGRETAKASIGSSATAPFSNVLANLKPSTTYYCRAVMNNQYGTVKGEIVAFKTKAKAVTYVKPVTQTTTKKTTATKTVAKKNEIVCSDGTTVSTGSKSSADLINSGQKLISLQMEKVSGTLAPGSVVNHRLVFKNLSDETLRGVTVKVTIPAEMTLMQASSGTYDPATRTLTATIPSLGAGAEGSVGWTGSIASSTPVGKSVAMTGYASYTVPGTDVQDEVTAYSVGQIVPATDGSADTGAKKVVGASSVGFLPNSLVEWLALLAIIFIIFILARSVYSSYRDEKTVH